MLSIVYFLYAVFYYLFAWLITALFQMEWNEAIALVALCATAYNSAIRKMKEIGE